MNWEEKQVIQGTEWVEKRNRTAGKSRENWRNVYVAKGITSHQRKEIEQKEKLNKSGDTIVNSEQKKGMEKEEICEMGNWRSVE